ncbi:hypothetical protein NDU88_006821 [Pleurodeles waltl]|uniref:Uncharacterized protein n=1 Tax=Pleurodeles waltl TaxID=8319 RepID=A0AAV7VQY4_PLEWA|nr:hypothetical protein NDU88_006821 [Pleurodeles waltl]
MKGGWMPARNQDRSHWPNQATNLTGKAEWCLNEKDEDVQAPPMEEQEVEPMKEHPTPTAPLRGENSTSEVASSDSGETTIGALSQVICAPTAQDRV